MYPKTFVALWYRDKKIVIADSESYVFGFDPGVVIMVKFIAS